MNSYVRALMGLGNAGAVANARRACEAPIVSSAAVEAQLVDILSRGRGRGHDGSGALAPPDRFVAGARGEAHRRSA